MATLACAVATLPCLGNPTTVFRPRTFCCCHDKPLDCAHRCDDGCKAAGTALCAFLDAHGVAHDGPFLRRALALLATWCTATEVALDLRFFRWAAGTPAAATDGEVLWLLQARFPGLPFATPVRPW